MKEIILHLGPPKTGTTTIQQVLCTHLQDSFIGNNSKKTELSEKILSYVRGDLSIDVEEVKTEIRKLLSSRHKLVYSDERILFEYNSESNWHKQVAKLFHVFDFKEI